MTLSIWGWFFLANLGAALSPGPNILNVLNHASKYGYRSIFVTISGNMFSQVLMVLAIYFGVATILLANEKLYFFVRLAGALYLIFLGLSGFLSLYRGWKIERRRDADAFIDAVPSKPLSLSSRFIQGALVASSNPKTIVFLSAFLPQFVVTGRPIFTQFAIMYVTIVATVFGVHATYAALFMTLGRRLPILNRRSLFKFLSSTIYLVLGATLGLFG